MRSAGVHAPPVRLRQTDASPTLELVDARALKGLLDERGGGQPLEGAGHVGLVDKQPTKHNGHLAKGGRGGAGDEWAAQGQRGETWSDLPWSILACPPTPIIPTKLQALSQPP